MFKLHTKRWRKNVMFNTNKLIYIMNKKNINIYRLSKRANMSIMTISDLVNGKTKNPRINTLYKMADGLSVDVTELV